ncbi:MAG TPA: FkbM family methyltransferase [Chitinophagaceae bacterium]|nr:FkbM family methyltransferase [Chitinophagaceae bacterium]
MGIFESIKSIIGYIWQSPSNKGQKMYRVSLAIAWQCYKRIVGLPIISELDNGAKFILEPNSTNSTGNIYVKTYEAEYIYFLRKHILKGGLIIDIGAHMGLYTLLLNDLFVGGYCFEPAPDTFRALKTNLFINDLVEKFLPINSAVSETSTVQALKMEGTFSGVNYLVRNMENAENVAIVSVVSIDNFLTEKSEKEKIHFIKIDTEGNELKVLEGGLQTLKNNSHLILLFENSSPTNLIAILSSINFKVFSIDKTGNIFSDKNFLLHSYNLFAVGPEHPLFKQLL